MTTEQSFIEPSPNFTALHEWMRDSSAAGTLFVPADLESMYEQWAEDDDNLPPYAEVREAMLDSWTWRKGMSELMSERGYEMLASLISEVAAGRRSDL